MDNIKRKILLDLFVHPMTVLPVTAGITSLMASWTFGLGASFSFLGIVGVLVGFGFTATKLVFGLDKVTNDAYQYQSEQEQIKKNETLNDLNYRLVKDDDPRTEELLQRLRLLYDAFHKDVKSEKITSRISEILSQAEALFEACVGQLEKTLVIYEKYRRLPARNKVRKQLIKDRDEIIEEVEKSVDLLDSITREFHVAVTTKGNKNLSNLRMELKQSMETAKSVEEKISMIGSKVYESSEYE